MKKVILVLLMIVVLNEAKFHMPKCMKTCSRNDTNINKCFETNANSALRTCLPKGDPKYNLKPIKPLIWTDFSRSIEIPGFKFSLKSITVYGLENMTVTNATIDFDKKTIDFVFVNPEICWKGKYIAHVDQDGKQETIHGDAVIHLQNGKYLVSMQYDLQTIDGDEYANISKYAVHFLQSDVKIKCDALDTNPRIRDSWLEVKQHFVNEEIEGHCGHKGTEYFNHIFNVVPFNEVFPK